MRLCMIWKTVFKCNKVGISVVIFFAFGGGERGGMKRQATKFRYSQWDQELSLKKIKYLSIINTDWLYTHRIFKSPSFNDQWMIYA